MKIVKKEKNFRDLKRSDPLGGNREKFVELEASNFQMKNGRIFLKQERRGKKWCPGGDSNPHAFRHQILNLARLPIPPPGLGAFRNA
jgi:hypothetical protein